MPKHPWPATRTDAIVDTVHGLELPDPYRWLEDETSPEVQAWMTAQDEYTRAELAKLPGREAIASRLRELFYYDAISAPSPSIRSSSAPSHTIWIGAMPTPGAIRRSYFTLPPPS